MNINATFSTRPDAVNIPILGSTSAPFPAPRESLRALPAFSRRVAANLAAEFDGAISVGLLQQMVNEAAALAATTAFPTLFLPALAEEKARQAEAWTARQRALRHDTITLSA